MRTKDKNIDFFLDKLEDEEIIYKGGNLYSIFHFKGRRYNKPKKMGKWNSKGYVQLSAKVDGKEITASAHRVIWAYFYGREHLNPNLEINHINGIKDDNRIENLELVTSSENQLHAYRTGLKKPQLGESNPDSKLSTAQVKRIRELIELGLTNIEISKIYDVTPTAIYHIRNGKTWSNANEFDSERSLNRAE